MPQLKVEILEKTPFEGWQPARGNIPHVITKIHKFMANYHIKDCRITLTNGDEYSIKRVNNG